MVVTATGKVIDERRKKSAPLFDIPLPRLESNYNYKEIAEVRLNKINHQLNLLGEMKQLNHAVYTVKDIKLLISDIQYTLDVVEDKLIKSSIDFGITKESEEDM